MSTLCRPCIYEPIISKTTREIKRRPKYFDNPEYIIATTCYVLGVFQRAIKGKSRQREICEARQIAMKIIADEFRGISLDAIGRLFGRDHSTVIYNRQVFDDLIMTHRSFRAKYVAVYNHLKNDGRELEYAG